MGMAETVYTRVCTVRCYRGPDFISQWPVDHDAPPPQRGSEQLSNVTLVRKRTRHGRVLRAEAALLLVDCWTWSATLSDRAPFELGRIKTVAHVLLTVQWTSVDTPR